MAGKGFPPKPAHLRQRRNKKPGEVLPLPPDSAKANSPTLPNPDKRKWHRLTRAWWKNVWASPMASQYLSSDIDGLGRVAILVDTYYKGNLALLSEIRLQEARFGLSPVDRQRLQWTIARETEPEQDKPSAPQHRSHNKDPRGILGVVK